MSERNWPGAENDPPGSEFYCYPVKRPVGDWAYIVDDFDIGYRRDTLWPFRGTRAGDASDETHIREFYRRARNRGENWQLGEGCGWKPVRLAPDSEDSAGGQNYVSVWPSLDEAWQATADLNLYVRPQGLGAVVMNCTLVIDLRDMTGHVTTWPIGESPTGADGFSENFPQALKAQAEEIKAKILAVLAAHMAARDGGKRKVQTAA